MGVTFNATATDIKISPCGDGSFCCGPDATACCMDGKGYWIVNGKVYGYNDRPTATPSASSSSTSGSKSPASTSKGSTPASSANNNPDAPIGTPAASSSSNKIALGVGLGIGVPVVLLLTGILACLWRRKSRSKGSGIMGRSSHEEIFDPALNQSQDYKTELVAPSPPPQELSTERGPAELPT